MTAVGVVGTGVVGHRSARLLGGDHPLLLFDRRGDAAATASAAVRTARSVGTVDDVLGAAVVLLAMPGPHAELSERLVRSGSSVVSTSGSVDDVQALLDLDDLARQHQVTLLVGGGMSPGLSGLLARWLVDGMHLCDELHVAVHGTAGPSCAREHHRALGGKAIGWHDNRWVERQGGSGRELCWFPEPVGAYDCYRADVSEPVTLHRTFPEVARVSARMSANRRDRLTSRLPMLTPPHREGGIGALRVEARGADASGARIARIAGIAERVGMASAATASAFVRAIAERRIPPGAVAPGAATLPTVELLAAVCDGGVRVQGFTGVPEARAPSTQ